MHRLINTKSALGCLTLFVGLVSGNHSAIADTAELIQRNATVDGKAEVLNVPATVNTNNNFNKYGTFKNGIIKTNEQVIMPGHGGLKPPPKPKGPGRHDNLPTMIIRQ